MFGIFRRPTNLIHVRDGAPVSASGWQSTEHFGTLLRNVKAVERIIESEIIAGLEQNRFPLLVSRCVGRRVDGLRHDNFWPTLAPVVSGENIGFGALYVNLQKIDALDVISCT